MHNLAITYFLSTQCCNISNDEHSAGTHQPFIEAEEEILEWADRHCTDAGVYEGDQEVLRTVIDEIIIKHFGDKAAPLVCLQG